VFKESPIHCKERLKPGPPGATHHPSSQQHDARARASPAPRAKELLAADLVEAVLAAAVHGKLVKDQRPPQQRFAQVAGIYLDSSKMC
jgi:hypothetical protein